MQDLDVEDIEDVEDVEDIEDVEDVEDIEDVEDVEDPIYIVDYMNDFTFLLNEHFIHLNQNADGMLNTHISYISDCLWNLMLRMHRITDPAFLERVFSSRFRAVLRKHRAGRDDFEARYAHHKEYWHHLAASLRVLHAVRT